jgi:hypothetical protein
MKNNIIEYIRTHAPVIVYTGQKYIYELAEQCYRSNVWWCGLYREPNGIDSELRYMMSRAGENTCLSFSVKNGELSFLLDDKKGTELSKLRKITNPGFVTYEFLKSMSAEWDFSDFDLIISQ